MLHLADLTPEQRHDILIEAALDYMEHQDWYCSDFDPDPEVLDQLEEVYNANPDVGPTPCSGSPIFDTGVTIALLWERDRRVEYERALPVWRCDCGASYKREQWALANETVYTITADGLLDEIVGSTKGKRGLRSQPRDERFPVNNGSCPSCGVAFTVTIARQLDPQTSLLFDLA